MRYPSKSNTLVTCGAIVCALVIGSALRTSAQAPAPLTKITGPIYTEAQANRGAAVFKEQCAGCHRPNFHEGEGDPSLTGPHFLEAWGLVSLGSMANLIRTTMPPDVPPNTLSVQQVTDIVAYVLYLNYYPAGTKELPPDLDALSKLVLQTPEEHLQMYIDMAAKKNQP